MTTSEKRLLGILGIVFLGGGLFTGSKTLVHEQAALEAERSELRASQAEAMVDFQSESTWTARRNWIRLHEPVLHEQADASAQTLDFLVKGARDQHLEVQDRNLGEVRGSSDGTTIESELKVKGSLEALSRWIAALQQPENFYAIDLFSLQADPDQKSIVCTLRIGRFFQGAAK